jgi:hypothetical protein
MNDRDRLKHLRGLLLRLERMPASADRDWMLHEVRARAVDVESGMTPVAVRALPVSEAAEPAAAPAPARVQNTPPCREARVRPSPSTARRQRPGFSGTLDLLQPAERPASSGARDLLQPGERLCLDDPPAGDAAARPWAGGLRG